MNLKIYGYNFFFFITWAGTETASFEGMSLNSRNMKMRLKAEADRTFAKKTFQTVNQITL